MKATARIMSAGSGLLILLTAGYAALPVAAQAPPAPLLARVPVEEQRRFDLQRRSPESEAMLRAFIEGLQAGQPDYEAMSPDFAAWIRSNPPLVERAKALGPIRTMRFRSVVSPSFGENYVRDRCPQPCPDVKPPVTAGDSYQVIGDKGAAQWVLATAPDGRIDWVTARPLNLPPADTMSLDAASAAVRAELDRQVAADQFSGAVRVARNGKEIFSFASGKADREKQLAVTPETKFRLGSMNKMFTAVAIMQLVESGKIDLGAPLGRYLTDYPNKELAGSVTIHHLLTHTGGTGDIFGPEFEARRLSLRTHQDYVDLYGARAGTGAGGPFSYSNYGFLLLGRIIERVSGLSYYDYVDRHIFAPAGMRNSGSLPESENVPGRSIAYTKLKGPLASAADTLPYRGMSAGGGYSTAGDMIRFGQALLSNTLLSPLGFKYLTSGKVRLGDGFYGYGFFEVEDATGRWVGHGGGAPGMNGDLRIYPATGTVIVALSNLDPPSASNALMTAANRLVPAIASASAEAQ